MGEFIAFLAVVGFGYFIYTRVEASRKRKAEREANPGNPSRGGGGGDNEREIRRF